MEQVMSPAATTRQRGRWWFWLGIAVALLGIVIYVVQFALKHLVVPWHMAALGTAGVLFVLVSLWQRVTVGRFVGLVLLALLCAGEWYLLLGLSVLPEYSGPAKVGTELPAFATTLANGSSFTEQDLKTGTSTVLLFFRGRW
jgi:hypothetical protein